jgi:hypothetical protein
MQAQQLPQQLPLAGLDIPQPRPRPVRSAQERKLNGQFAAARRAGQRWKDDMMIALRRYIAILEGGSCGKPDLTFEGFRMYCEAERLPKPDSMNAWGSLPRVAVAAGIVLPTDRVLNAVRPASHARLIRVWSVA